MIKKCIGCGSFLQTEDKTKEGYINSKVYEKANYCERCFKITHYGEISVLEKKVLVLDFIRNIDINIPVLYLIDLTCVSNVTLEPLKNIKNKIYLVLTKRDLLPKSVKNRKIISYIKDNISKEIEDIFVVSSEKMVNIDLLFNKLINDKVKTCYVLGHTNSGKSSLINSFLKRQGENSFITTSSVPNTTVELINIKLNDNLTIIDTPGFVNESSISNFIELNNYKKILPRKEIKPKIYTIRSNYMIIIENILRIENNTNDNLELIFYLKNELNYNKMKVITRNDLKILDKVIINIEDNEDIVIEGLGFIKVVGSATLTIYTLDRSIISKRNKMI